MGIDLVGGDDLAEVELDDRYVADFGTGGQVVFGIDNVAEIPLSTSGAVLGRQETGQHVGRQPRVRIDGHEVGLELPRRGVDAHVDVHFEVAVVVGHGHDGLAVLAALRHGDHVIAEANLGQLKRRPVQVAIELVRDCHKLGRGRGRRFILEIYAIAQQAARHDVTGSAVPPWPELLVGIT